MLKTHRRHGRTGHTVARATLMSVAALVLAGVMSAPAAAALPGVGPLHPSDPLSPANWGWE